MSDLVKREGSIWKTKKSVEDIQFSPEDPEALACCYSDGKVRVFDLRTPFDSVSELRIDAHECDVNVISWNRRSKHLLASGAEDGCFKIWDLRYTAKPAISRISWHSEPICSIEWNPFDEWVIGVCSSDNRLSIWDLSVEKDDEELRDKSLADIPEQLLFLHYT